MIHIFLIFTIFPIMWEFGAAMKPMKYKAISQRMKEKKFDDFSTSEKSIAILMILYLFWMFLGLFTSQWLIFLFLISIGMIPKKIVFIRVIDNIITIIALFFIVINQYHLHIDIFQILKDL